MQFIAVSQYGTCKRNSKTRIYTHAVVRSDGWHMFSQSLEAAEREARFQRGRGRSVEIVSCKTTD